MDSFINTCTYCGKELKYGVIKDSNIIIDIRCDQIIDIESKTPDINSPDQLEICLKKCGEICRNRCNIKKVILELPYNITMMSHKHDDFYQDYFIACSKDCMLTNKNKIKKFLSEKNIIKIISYNNFIQNESCDQYDCKCEYNTLTIYELLKEIGLVKE
jgi:hypothetical protein